MSGCFTGDGGDTRLYWEYFEMSFLVRWALILASKIGSDGYISFYH